MAIGNRKKILKLVFINFVVLMVVAEIVSLSVYLIKHGTLFYFDSDRAEPMAMEREEPRTDRGKQLTNKRFHPFFGFTYAADLKNTNNYGFECPHDLPLEREHPNRYIIAVFGGSVADDFYREGRERLAEQLKKKSAFTEKEIVFINFAVGGFKQPQQLQILSYFLSIGQEIDLVINIDGFNEIVFCANNTRLNVDKAMPSAQHFLPMRDLMDKHAMTGEKLEIAWNIRQLRHRIQKLDQKIKTTPLASLYWINTALRYNAYTRYREEILLFDRLIGSTKKGGADSLLNIKQTPFNSDETQMLKDITLFWARCSMSMHHLQTRWGGSYIHIVQPNQYHSGKTFSKEELQVAVDEKLPYNYLVKKGYPVLLESMELLKKKNVMVASAVAIFDNVKETVYTDNCCHFNAKGHYILADFIATLIR